MHFAIASALTKGDITGVIEKLSSHIPGLRVSNVEEHEQSLEKAWSMVRSLFRRRLGSCWSLVPVVLDSLMTTGKNFYYEY